MRTRLSNTPQVSRLRPLVACLAIAFGGVTFAGEDVAERVIASNHPASTLRDARTKPATDASLRLALEKSVAAAPDHPTTILTVENCDDAGTNSLREAVGAAPDGATIQFDMNQMQCSTITLTSGQINITQASLTIQGPGSDLLTIDGDYSVEHHYNRIFNHSGQGTLKIEGLTLTDAKYLTTANGAYGGCVNSNGIVGLVGSTVSGCHLVATGARSTGGGIYAREVYMLDSTISDCHVLSGTNTAEGGGVSVNVGGFTAKYSTIENNVAHSYSQSFSGLGGGVLAAGAPTQIEFSTISGNKADVGGGLLTVSSSATATISNSTFSGNTAQRYGGMNIRQNKAYLYNATIAFNSDTVGSAGAAAGSLQSNSSIFAYNITDDGSGAVETDVESDDGMITGAANLIIATNANTTPPMDTSTACPRLAPLLDNGGLTRTHALLPDSPAIDAGNNVKNLDTDQRGTGFDRLVGMFVDIGAYEFKAGSGDVINMSGFENCK